MNKRILALILVVQAQLALATPSDTYFSFALTENSSNHGGENLLYLDFQPKLDLSARSANTVLSVKVASTAIQLDASLEDWRQEQFTILMSRVMNNYPLDKFYDVVPTQVHLASAYDDQHIYFAIRYVDANHDASINKNRWIKNGEAWQSVARKQPQTGTPLAQGLNATADIFGEEDDDRVFFMFPIIDNQNNFREGSHGCAGYCHGNLVKSGSPYEKAIGQGVAEMHTNDWSDLADVWQWTAGRTGPANSLRDGFISVEGHKGDQGKAAYLINREKRPARPAFISRTAYEEGRFNLSGYIQPRLSDDDLLSIKEAAAIAEGASVPYYISRKPSGGRGDVEAASRFNPETKEWVIELKRKLDTGNPEEDRIFTRAEAAAAPVAEAITPGDVALGKQLYKDKKCFACHGDNGEGKFVDGQWQYPRVQRASGGLIFKTASPDRPKRVAALAYKSSTGGSRQRVLMPTIDISAQEAEHIAAWLQTRYTPIQR